MAHAVDFMTVDGSLHTSKHIIILSSSPKLTTSLKDERGPMPNVLSLSAEQSREILQFLKFKCFYLEIFNVFLTLITHRCGV